MAFRFVLSRSVGIFRHVCLLRILYDGHRRLNIFRLIVRIRRLYRPTVMSVTATAITSAIVFARSAFVSLRSTPVIIGLTIVSTFNTFMEFASLNFFYLRIFLSRQNGDGLYH